MMGSRSALASILPVAAIFLYNASFLPKTHALLELEELEALSNTEDGVDKINDNILYLVYKSFKDENLKEVDFVESRSLQQVKELALTGDLNDNISEAFSDSVSSLLGFSLEQLDGSNENGSGPLSSFESFEAVQTLEATLQNKYGISSMDNVRVDARSGRVSSLIMSTPILPGGGEGNTLEWSVHSASDRSGQVDEEAFGQPKSLDEWNKFAIEGVQHWITDRQAELKVDAAELFGISPDDPSDTRNLKDRNGRDESDVDFVATSEYVLRSIRTAVHSDGELIQMVIPRQFRGVPVVGSQATASIENGNLVHLGLDQWGDIEETFGIEPDNRMEDAMESVFEYLLKDERGRRYLKSAGHDSTFDKLKEHNRKLREGGGNGQDRKLSDGSFQMEEEIEFWDRPELQILMRTKGSDTATPSSRELEAELDDTGSSEFSNRPRARILSRRKRKATTDSSTELGQGYTHHLVWRLCPKFTDDNAERIEVFVDAKTNEIYSFENKVDFIFDDENLESYQDIDMQSNESQRGLQSQKSLRVTGSVYPTANDNVAPDGICQSGWPMPFQYVKIDGKWYTTDMGGNINLGGVSSASAYLSGPYVKMDDDCGSAELKGSGEMEWGENSGTDCSTPGYGGRGNTHASRSGFYELNMISEMARSHLPGNSWLKKQIVANMNIESSCNAYWNGKTVNFYRRSSKCSNTGENAAVFDHEWGHGLDHNDVTGKISKPSGEGIADIYAGLRLNDSCIGRGFYRDGTKCKRGDDKCTYCTGVREIDYKRYDKKRPHTLSWTKQWCDGSVHCLGLPIAEAVWSLYTRHLPAYYGYDTNTALEVVTRMTFVAAGHVGTWYSSSAPYGGCESGSGYLSYLIADDDDGNLNNGTPHMKAIYAAFNENEIACNRPSVMDSGCNGTPTTPPQVTAVAGYQKVSLSWDYVAGASSYQVFRTEGVKGCDHGKIKVGDTPGNSFVDVGLQEGREYYYVVIPKGPRGSCFGRSSQCISATPVPLPELLVSCPSDRVVLNLIDEFPQEQVTCTFTAVGGFNLDVSLSCDPGSDGATCTPSLGTLSFSGLEDTESKVTFDIKSKVNAVGFSSTLQVIATYGNDKIVKSLALSAMEYGEAQMASFDGKYMAPACSSAGRYCSSGTLLNGGGKRGPEKNSPNTIGNSCQDGQNGKYKSDESVESIMVRSGQTSDDSGPPLKEGNVATIEAQVYPYGSGASDTVDFFYAADALNPEWVWIDSLRPGSGLSTVKTSYTLPTNAPYQAVRVAIRYKASRTTCPSGSYDDADDLVFTVLPSDSLVLRPTGSPTDNPSASPTTGWPTFYPTLSPTITSVPTEATKAPTVSPTDEPTMSPTTSKSPSISPTESPTTESPTANPTYAPTTDAPTATPTTEPTTDSPTTNPTFAPTTDEPTLQPTTDAPTATPTTKPPSTSPTLEPTTDSPTANPTHAPTTGEPTATPTTKPPSTSPTLEPTTDSPTANPTYAPTTGEPTANPTTKSPSKSPTSKPTGAPTENPVGSEPLEPLPSSPPPPRCFSKDFFGNVIAVYTSEKWTEDKYLRCKRWEEDNGMSIVDYYNLYGTG